MRGPMRGPAGEAVVPDGGPRVVAAPPGYREWAGSLLAAGHRFAGLSVAPGGDAVRAWFAAPGAGGEVEIVTAPVVDGAAPALVDLVPAADWDEREAHDLHGIRFTGHEPLRPLVDHDAPLAAWTVPVHGEDAYQVAVGPIHAGVIESGHFRFHLVGDRILHLDARLFYKHRGLERAAEGRSPQEALAYVARACAACAVASPVAYALAVEQLTGLVSTPQLARPRTVLLELERVWNHLNDVAAVCAGVGLAAGNTRFSALTDRMRRLNAGLAGHRFLFGAVRIGRSDLALDAGGARALREELAQVRAAASASWRDLVFNPSFAARLTDVGVVTADDARRLGTVGPAARAAGLADDVRTRSPHLAYEGFEPVRPDLAGGDVRARFEQRALELWQSFDLLDRLLDGPLVPAEAEPSSGPPGPAGSSGPPAVPAVAVGQVESPRGATSCLVESDGGRVTRLRLRTGSFANWPSVAFAAAGTLLPDFPLVNKSFELCYACADR